MRQAVWSCYQETPTAFREYSLSDPGAWPDEPLCGGITWRVTRPEAEPKDEEERRQVQKLKKMMADIKKRAAGKRQQ